MVYTISLKEQRAQVIIKEMNNSTKIISGPDEEGWCRVAIEITHDFDALSLYHAGMEAKKQFDKEFAAGARI
jgi:hypothetical protein